MKKGMKILVAYDGSDPSKHAVNQAVSLAELTESEVTILSVVPDLMLPALSDGGTGASVSVAQKMVEYHQEMKEYYASSLDNIHEEIKVRHPDLRLDTVLMEGRPSQKIADMAEDDGFDLIVIGSRGLGGITGWILGSTSKKVVESCKVPVLVVK